ncbi:MAG: hypothetical protein ACRDRL_11550 [Sciscionella sp.]
MGATAALFSAPTGSVESILKSVGVVLGALWPLVAFAAILLLFLSHTGKQFLSGVGSGLRRVKLGQFELELNPDTAPQVKAGLEVALATYRDDVQRQFDISIQAHNLEVRRDAVARTVVSVAATNLPANQQPGGGAASIRCTVYAPDSLIADALYCLLNYWPRGDRPAGEAFSARYGIIGRCWRLGKSEAENVPADQDRLVGEWGMTRNEARDRATTPKSYLAVLLTHERAPVGVLYADGPLGAFKMEDCSSVSDAEATRDLAATLARVLEDVSKIQPRVHVFAR